MAWPVSWRKMRRHQSTLPPSTSSIGARSSSMSRGWARKKGSAIPGTPSGVNQSSETQKYGRKARPFASSSRFSSSMRASRNAPSFSRSRSQKRRLRSSSSVKLPQAGSVSSGGSGGAAAFSGSLSSTPAGGGGGGGSSVALHV